MKTRLNKIISWILRLFLFTLILIVFYILTLAYPQPIFAHKLHYNNFTIDILSDPSIKEKIIFNKLKNYYNFTCAESNKNLHKIIGGKNNVLNN